MIDRMRRKGTARFAALALILSMSAAPAQAVDLAAGPRLQSLEDTVRQSVDPADTTAPADAPTVYEPAGQGEASYYGAELAGHRTASGDRFDPRAFTAAHRSLPIGTMLRVTNMANGRSVVVRVNDRGPFAHSRILDVSLAAARDIDMVRSGKAMVRLDIVRTIA
jgi:rare lipoprotein A